MLKLISRAADARRDASRLRHAAETLHEHELCRPVGADRERLLTEAVRVEQRVWVFDPRTPTRRAQRA